MKRKVNTKRLTGVVLLLSAIVLPSVLHANDIKPAKEDVKGPKKEYSPYVNDHYPQNVYFGDTHLHTSWSTDAGMAGASVGPDDAYKVSRGDTITSHLGWKVKLVRPLDFVVVADHAENLGLADFIRRSDPVLLANKTGKRWHDMVKDGKGYDVFIEWLQAANNDKIADPKMVQAVWSKVVKNADKYYQPGVFTTFHGFEWTSHPDGNNMHRVVIFRDGGDKTSKVMPYSQFDSVDAEDLWNYMAGYEKLTGGSVLAIPHNGNLSNGLMFDESKTYSGKPLTRQYVETRAEFEPMYEVSQMKGDAEAHPLLSPDDEFADFETMDAGNLSGFVAKTPEMLPREYARAALKAGLKLEENFGVNPYKFGMVGSTDAHTGIPTTREENNWSKAHIAEPSADRYKHALVQGAKPELSIMVEDVGAAGLAAVWARENTRESIWDAMKRKEVYATTGTRLKVRVFGGWDFASDEVHRPDFARQGYKRGVPMGGDLTEAPSGKAPSFMVRALRDADGANIDRVQVIKGWLDGDETHERIYDIAVSGDRKIDAKGRCKTPVGNTVDIPDASYTNTIGAPMLAAHWTDPDFDPKQRAFYYVRVIEIPTPRWTAYDAKFFKLKMPKNTKMQLQDRAYTSPIWYTP
jgi:hypothetical protein